MEQTIKWVKGDRPEKEGWYFVLGKRIRNGELLGRMSSGYFYRGRDTSSWPERLERMVIEYHAEIIGPNGEKYE